MKTCKNGGGIVYSHIINNKLNPKRMKRILFVMSVLIMSAVSVSAQDLITKKNGEDIKAKVLEIDNTNVKYKLFDEPDGVTYTMPKSQILMIRYQSGRNEVFNTAASNNNYGTGREPVGDLRPGMKYKELKNIYSYQDWQSGRGDQYNPALMGVCSWLIPGLGQMISGEVGRGIGWLGGTVGCGIVMGIGGALVSEGAYNMYEYDEYGMYYAGIAVMTLGSLAMLTVDICAIVDACRVAKVKNMYEQDMRQNNFSMELRPSIDFVNMATGVQPTAGFTLAMKF